MSTSISESESEEVQRLRAALASALTSENAALKEVARLRTPCNHMPTCGCFAHGHREGRRAGVAEERARWTARLERLRTMRNEIMTEWTTFDPETRQWERALALDQTKTASQAIAIMSGEGEVKP